MKKLAMFMMIMTIVGSVFASQVYDIKMTVYEPFAQSVGCDTTATVVYKNVNYSGYLVLNSTNNFVDISTSSYMKVYARINGKYIGKKLQVNANILEYTGLENNTVCCNITCSIPSCDYNICGIGISRDINYYWNDLNGSVIGLNYTYSNIVCGTFKCRYNKSYSIKSELTDIELILNTRFPRTTIWVE